MVKTGYMSLKKEHNLQTSTRQRRLKYWVFFDLDGTLADSLDVMWKVYLAFLAQFGKQGSQKEFDELNGPSMGEIITILRDRYGLKGRNEDLSRLYKLKLSDVYLRQVKLFPGAQRVLSVLRRLNYRMVLVTSAEKKIALQFIRDCNLEQYFSHYVFGDEIKASKPDPAIYRLALAKCRAKENNVVVVEDSINGIHSARQAGLYVIGVLHGRSKKDLLLSQADKLVSGLRQIVPIIENYYE